MARSSRLVSGGRSVSRWNAALNNARLFLRRLGLFALVLLVIAIIGYACLPYAGTYLIVDSCPDSADVIIVLSGDTGERLEHAVALYQRKVAPLLLISGGPVYESLTAADLMKAHAERLGVSPSVIIVENRADSTLENALYTLPMVKERGLDSAVVVSSPYHMRRVKAVFEQVYARSDVDLTYSPAPGWYDPESWWHSPRGIDLTLSEYLKLVALRLQIVREPPAGPAPE